MTVRLAVHENQWQSHVQQVASAMPNLVPVVKGNGYGFRRWNLMPVAGQLANEIAVGTVYEARDLPAHTRAIVLTPTLTAPPSSMPANTVLTVGSLHHVVALERLQWTGDVMVKLRSSMHRYGVGVNELPQLLDACRETRLHVYGYSIHPPLQSDMKSRVKEIVTWAGYLSAEKPMYLSHLDAPAYEAVRKQLPERQIRIRMGTELWHGDKSMMHLSADIVDHHSVESGDAAGYRQIPITSPGEVVMVGAGTAHGVSLLDNGRSPFHYQRQRLNLLEPPHMHTSMLLVARGRPIPAIGEWIDLQQPLTRIQVDLLQWVR
jgi:alanine racemase